jgi:hypothetical protein
MTVSYLFSPRVYCFEAKPLAERWARATEAGIIEGKHCSIEFDVLDVGVQRGAVRLPFAQWQEPQQS